MVGDSGRALGGALALNYAPFGAHSSHKDCALRSARSACPDRQTQAIARGRELALSSEAQVPRSIPSMRFDGTK